MKRIFFLFTFIIVLATVILAQSVAITTPGAGTPTITGTLYTLTASLTSITNAAYCQWTIDGEQFEYNTIASTLGSACTPLPWNTFNIFNGTHSFQVCVYDGATLQGGTAIACSATVLTEVNNAIPYNDGSGIATKQATCTGLTGTLSGVISLSCSSSGTDTSSNSLSFSYSLDGAGLGPFDGTHIDTRAYPNGTHKFLANLCTTISGGTVQDNQCVASYQVIITISNTSVANSTQASASEVFLTSSTTAYTFGKSTLITTTGATSSVAPLVFVRTDIGGAATAVVASSTTITEQGTYGVTGAVEVMAPSYSGTTLYVDTGSSGGNVYLWDDTEQFQIYQSAGTFGDQGGAWIYISACGIGSCVPGWYPINGYSCFNGACGGGHGTNSVRLDISSASLCPTDNCSGIHYTIGPTRLIWAFVNSVNTVPHFGRNGNILTSYSPYSSIFLPSTFYNNSGTGQFSYPNYAKDSAAAGFTAIEFPGAPCPNGYTDVVDSGTFGTPFLGCSTTTPSQATWTANLQSYVTYYSALGTTNGFYLRLQNTSLLGAGSISIYNWTNAVTGFSIPPWQIMSSQYATVNNCTPSSSQFCLGSIIGMTNQDEVTNPLGRSPHYGATIGAGGTALVPRVSAITGNGTTCTLTLTGGYLSLGGTTSNLVITGATHTVLNTAYPTPYSLTQTTATAATFPCTFNGSGDATATFHFSGYYSASSPGYLAYNTFTNLLTWAHNGGTNYARTSWPVVGTDVTSLAASRWMGVDTAVADHGEFYSPNSTNTVNAPWTSEFLTHASAFGSYIGTANVWQQALNYSPGDQHPFGAIAQENSTYYYVFTGKNVTFTNFSGGIVTTSSDHGFRNVYPTISRVAISGASNSADNTTLSSGTCSNNCYLVMTYPTATQIQLGVYPMASTAAATVSIHFADGTTVTGLTINFGSVGGTIGGFSSCPVELDSNTTFTVTAQTPNTDWEGSTYWLFPTNDPNNCSLGDPWQFYQVASGSSTSGTVSIINDNYIHRGWSGAGAAFGAVTSHVQIAAAVNEGASYVRVYAQGTDMSSWWPYVGQGGTTFAYLSQYNNWPKYGNYQLGVYAPNDMGGGAADSWYGSTVMNLLTQRLAPFRYGQPRFNTPDWGAGYTGWCGGDAGATYGNACSVTNFWDNTTSPSVTTILTPYEVSGQNIWRYVSGPLVGSVVTSISAGTTSDTVMLPIGWTVAYVFAKSASAWLTLPSISMKLTDVNNATGCSVEYNQSTYQFGFQQPQAMHYIPNVSSLGSGCSGTISVDPQMGHVYQRILYLGANGILSRGSIF